jgi:hypothetical protein
MTLTSTTKQAAACVTIGLLACASALPAYAAKLYQVELVVFANEPYSYERKETWPNDIELTLPRPLQLLRDADGIAPGASADMNTFESLPRESLALKNEAAALSRSGHRILLHKAWLQPIGGVASARNVYLEGGNSVEPFHELAGTLRLSLQQFVHIDTNLWLARFVSSTAASAPAAAPRPATARALTAATAEATTTNWPLPPLPPRQSDSVIDGDNATATESGGDIDALLKKEVTVERVVLMQQHRRLKQTELNPLFGALIVVTPYGATESGASQGSATESDPADSETSPTTTASPTPASRP